MLGGTSRRGKQAEFPGPKDPQICVAPARSVRNRIALERHSLSGRESSRNPRFNLFKSFFARHRGGPHRPYEGGEGPREVVG
jgi:hypothetical protein